MERRGTMKDVEELVGREREGVGVRYAFLRSQKYKPTPTPPKTFVIPVIWRKIKIKKKKIFFPPVL